MSEPCFNRVARHGTFAGSCLFLVAFFGSDLSAQEEQTWYQLLDEHETEISPKELKVHSISVSRLPIGDDGKVRRPDGNPSKGLGATGTAIYGTFEFGDAVPENLTALPSGQMSRFFDDHGIDLLQAVPYGRDQQWNAYTMPIVPKETIVIGFVVSAPNPPTPEATRVTAEATLLFQSMSDEKTEQRNLEISEGVASQSSIGPLRYTCTNVEGFIPESPRDQRRYETVKPKWRMILELRTKPLISIELLDENGQVIDDGRYPGRPRGSWNGLVTKGDRTTWLIPACTTKPTTIRIRWYEQFERIKVPIRVSASLGL